MVELNHKGREIRAKIIYYGPPAGGKTTNLLDLSRRSNPNRRGQMISVDTTQERTLLLDLVGLKAPAFRNYDMRFQVIAVPGQSMYAASRKFLLAGADAVVFVANSAADRWEETLESMKEMNEHLAAQGIDPKIIPIVLQYNKQDLPEVTPMEAMERTLNARKTDSFPAVAIRGEGVLEVFAAVLRRMLTDMMQGSHLGDRFPAGQSVEDWVENAMQMVFGYRPGESKDAGAAGTEAETEIRTLASDVALLDATPDDLWRMAVRVKPCPTSGPIKAMEPTEYLIEGYVEAAARLTENLEELREKQSQTEQRLDELGACLDAVRALLEEDASPQEVLANIIDRIGNGLGSEVSSLSLVRPDGKLSPIVLRNVESEPLFELGHEKGRSIPDFLMSRDQPVIFRRGESGPLQTTLDQLCANYTGLVSIPVKTPVRALGLVCFYLTEESAAPTDDSISHLIRLGQGLVLALEMALVDVAVERLRQVERAAMIGRLTEQAIAEIGAPIDRLLKSVGNAIAQIPEGTGGSPALLGELLKVSKELVKTQEMREGITGFLSEELPEAGVTSLEEVFEQIRRDYAESLQCSGIELTVERNTDVDTIAANAFLFRCSLSAILESSRNHLARCDAGEIRIGAEPLGDDRVRITVSDNRGAVAASECEETIPEYLSWSLQRQIAPFELTLAHKIAEHFKGDWQMSEKGSQISLTFPIPRRSP